VDAFDRVGGDGGDWGERGDGDERGGTEVWDEDAREDGGERRATRRGRDDVESERDRRAIDAKRIEGANGGDDGEVGGSERRVVAERGGDDFRDAAGRHAERASSRRELVFRIHRKRRWCVRRWFHPGVARTRAGSQTTGNVHRKYVDERFTSLGMGSVRQLCG
jgi:hypothetical protein